MKPCARYSALLAQACQHLWLVLYHDVYQEFTYVHHTIHPAPSPPDAGRYTLSSRFGCQSHDCGYCVRGHWTARYLAAVPRRILLMEQQVWSIPHARRSTVRPRVAAPHYRMAFASSILPCPHAYRLALRLTFPCGRRTGLPCSVFVTTHGVGALCPPVASMP